MLRWGQGDIPDENILCHGYDTPLGQARGTLAEVPLLVPHIHLCDPHGAIQHPAAYTHLCDGGEGFELVPVAVHDDPDLKLVPDHLVPLALVGAHGRGVEEITHLCATRSTVDLDKLAMRAR